MISMRRSTILFLVVVAGVLGALAGGWGALGGGWGPRATSSERPAAAQIQPVANAPARLVQAALPLTTGSFAQDAETVGPAVVNINTLTARGGGGRTPVEEFFGEEFFRRFFGEVPEREQQQRSLGSRVIVDASGIALTNAHVVERATDIKGVSPDGKKHKAKLVG